MKEDVQSEVAYTRDLTPYEEELVGAVAVVGGVEHLFLWFSNLFSSIIREVLTPSWQTSAWTSV